MVPSLFPSHRHEPEDDDGCRSGNTWPADLSVFDDRGGTMLPMSQSTGAEHSDCQSKTNSSFNKWTETGDEEEEENDDDESISWVSLSGRRVCKDEREREAGVAVHYLDKFSSSSLVPVPSYTHTSRCP